MSTYKRLPVDKNENSLKLVCYAMLYSQFNNVYLNLKEATLYYPDFKNWFYSKVIPGVLLGERKIILEARENNIAGIAIVNKGCEKKLATLRVGEFYKNKGLGIKLFEKSFEELRTDKPFLTVSEEKYPEFKKIFRYYGFKLTNIHYDLYRKNKKEYFFNEF